MYTINRLDPPNYNGFGAGGDLTEGRRTIGNPHFFPADVGDPAMVEKLKP